MFMCKEKIVPLLGVLIFLFGCNNQSMKNSEENPFLVIEVDFDKRKSAESVEWFSHLEIIPLETRDSSFFSMAKGSKILYFEENFYILDKAQNDIYVFDKNGNYRNSSKPKKGAGPEEYNMVYDFDINIKSREIEILDIAVYRIKKYNLDFSYVGDIFIPEDLYPINKFKIISSDVYCFYHNPLQEEESVLKMYHVNEKEIQKYLAVKKDKRPTTQTNPFYTHDNQIYFSYSFPNEDLFRISEDRDSQVTKVLEYDLGTYRLPFDRKGNYSDFPPEFFSTYNNYVFITQKYENCRYYFSFMQYDNELFAFRYNKDTHKQDIILWKFIDGGALLPPFFVDDEYFYVLASPEYLNEVVSLKLLNNQSKALLKNSVEDDNPVILKYKLK